MRFYCTTGLILLVTASWAASTASAQTNPYTPSLLPLPSVAPISTRSTPASYYTDPASYDADPNLGDPRGQAGQPQTGQPQVTSSFDEALHAPCCDECATCNSCCGGTWFGAAGGLIMGRNRANPYWTTYQTNNNPNQLMNTQNAGANWSGGGQITVGYAWCGCGGPALAFTYWGLAPMTGFSSVTDQTGNINTALSTPIDLGGVTMNNGILASHYFDNAHEQRIWRGDNFNNLELNVYQGFINTGRFQAAGLVGLRYFRFTESLKYGSVAFGHNFGDDGGADEAYMNFGVVNNMFGAQVGAFMNYMIWQRLGVFVIPKIGILGNQMNGRMQLYTGDSVGNPTYNIGAHASDITFLGELDAGFDWAITANWRAFLGYRVIGLANVALADNQFLPFLADTQGFSQMKQNGDLILHGAFFGAAWMF